MSNVVRTAFLFLLLFALACGSGDPLEEIRESQSAGRYSDTIDPLRVLLDGNSSQPEAALLLGTALLKTGNSGLAVWPLRKATETPEYAVEAGMLLTQAMIDSRTAPDAVKAIERVLAIEPNNVEALVLRVDANRAAGNVEESLADIDRVLELEPDNLPVLVTRVTALITLERIEEAAVALDAAQASFDNAKVQVANPMLARLCVARALFSFQNEELDAAERHYADCADRFPTDRIAVSEVILYYDRVGQKKRATEILERAAKEGEGGLFRTLLARRLGALGENEEEERLLREEAELRKSALSWFVLADFYVRHDRFDEAVDAFASSLAITPGSSRLRFAYADTLVQAGRLEEAREVSNRLEQTELRSLIRGRILLEEGNPRAALAAFEAGIRLWPNNAVGRFLAGQAAEQVGDFKRATSHYRESFRTSPGASEAGQALAELYSAQGLHEDGLQIAARYVSAHRSDPQAFLMSVRIAHALGREKIINDGLNRLAKMDGYAGIAAAQRASFLAADKGAEAAVESIEKAGLFMTDVPNAPAFRELIEQRAALGQYDESLTMVERSLGQHPDEAVFHELQGRARYLAGQADAARASYERALELDSQNWRALAGLAALAADVGDTSEALSLYDRAITANPDDPDAALAAIALVRETDRDDAVQRLTRFLVQHPRSASAANELAGIFADQGELNRASFYASRAAWFRYQPARETFARIEELRGATPAVADPATGDEANE